MEKDSEHNHESGHLPEEAPELSSGTEPAAADGGQSEDPQLMGQLESDGEAEKMPEPPERESVGEQPGTDGQNPAPALNSEPAAEQGQAGSQPAGEWFTELDGFRDVNLPPVMPSVAPTAETPPGDFFTGHWATADLPPADRRTQLASAKPQPPVEPNGQASSSDLTKALDEAATIPPEETPIPDASAAKPVLPERVSVFDPNATVLTPAAYSPAGQSQKQITQPVPVAKKQATQPVSPLGSTKPKKRKRKAGKGWLIALIVIFILGLLATGFVVYNYYKIASTLPDVQALRTQASQFETTRILDRNGNILYEIVDPNAGRRTYVPLERISPYLLAATIATEDKEYYNHPGFDVFALGRALWSNYTSGEIVSGGSTITQQLARMILLPDERFEQSYERKAREIILAAEITRRYTKDEVLELYLNEIFYGNLSYGVEAAAETYFDTTAADLTLWQAAFLAGLPQSPATYDIYNNRDVTLERTKTVLVLMYDVSREKNCIPIGEERDPVCVDAMQTVAAADELQAYNFTYNEMGMSFPHWVVFIQSLLEAQFDPQTIYRSGFTVYTTLDPDFQSAAQQAVVNQLAGMTANNATNGAVVAMDPNNGEILAMVGSADFHNEAISGQVNMAITRTRQPGSAIKPITYLAAFEKDWTPASLIWDVPSTFTPSGRPDDYGPAYEPVNYDGRFHGPVTVRSALANSYNIPAVKALEYVGIYDDPNTPERDGFIAMAERLGITSLTRQDYGLSLTLGGGEVSLLELTGAYSVLANEGRRVAPVAITKVVDYTGKVIFEYQPPEGDQVIRQAHAYLISSILSDNEARAPMFGSNSVLALPFEAAVKTGTTNDYRDNWTVGYTPDLVVGVWVGNADYSPMVNTSGVSGAAPIWANVMQAGINQFKGGIATPFGRPVDVVDQVICAASGTLPSEYCPQERTEMFASDQMPLPKENDLWAKVNIDGWTGLRASPACPDFAKEQLVVNVTDKSAVKWLATDQGRQWADDYGFPEPVVVMPERECRMDDPRAIIDLIGLSDGAVISENPYKIVGVVDATANFKQFKIHWGEGENPTEWFPLMDWRQTPVRSAEEIYTWDLSEIEATQITIRVTMHSTINTEVQKFYRVSLALPTPTPTVTPTVTATPTLPPTPTELPPASPTPPAENTPVPPTPTPTPDSGQP